MRDEAGSGTVNTGPFSDRQGAILHGALSMGPMTSSGTAWVRHNGPSAAGDKAIHAVPGPALRISAMHRLT